MEKEIKKAERIAEEILILSRNNLLVNLRFLDMALSKFSYLHIEDSTYMTDGECLLYTPKHVLNRFKLKKETPVRDYLHIVLHCVYSHMFVSPLVDIPVWNLACDIAVENVITELGLKCADDGRERPQWPHITRLKLKIKKLTAEKIYHYLKYQPLSDDEIDDLRKTFYVDDHSIWYMSQEEKHSKYGISQAEQQGGATGQQIQKMTFGSAELAEEWQKIAERIQVDLETFGKLQGTEAGSLIQNLKEVNREKYDYAKFLKKFAVMGEVMKINDDEFDYVYYTYGLKMYENMPLIEPLEYKEVKRIKEFVLAIDTSGSVMGEQVQKFVQKTYNVLKSTESFFSKINLHIIQCDADIQEHVKITNQEEFDKYLETMQIKGLGGTDFRPVFELTDRLIKEKEFTNLKGLIYFTDGFGVFPNKKPDYETAFVFVDDELNSYDVPSWAIKLILKSEEI